MFPVIFFLSPPISSPMLAETIYFYIVSSLVLFTFTPTTTAKSSVLSPQLTLKS